MLWYRGLETICRENVPLSELTFFRLGGPARWLFCPRDHRQLATVIERCDSHNIPWRIIGRGANILPDDNGFDGAVIRLHGKDLTGAVVRRSGDGRTLLAAAGADLGATARLAIRNGLAGLEGLAGIPATVGGAVRTNAGGRFGEIGNVVRRILVMDRTGGLRWLDRTRVRFGYRSSSLQGYVVLAVEFDLCEDDPARLLKAYRETWIYKRQRQPLAARSAGCVFKNPAGRSAALLIDRAGCKGLRIGGAEVSTLHANFFLARNGCTAADLKSLIAEVRKRVEDRFGVRLELEIEIWPYRDRRQHEAAKA